MLECESGVQLPEPDGGVEETPNRLVDIPRVFDIASKITVQLLGFCGEFLGACGVLL